jgi:hypothetical protein
MLPDELYSVRIILVKLAFPAQTILEMSVIAAITPTTRKARPVGSSWCNRDVTPPAEEFRQ